MPAREAAHTLRRLDNRQIRSEDIAPILYLALACHVLDPDTRVRHVLVDEAQDFTRIQYAVLRRLFPRAGFSLLGDENQNILTENAIGNLAKAAEILDPDSYACLQLNRTYRCTLPISRLADCFRQNTSPVDHFGRQGPLPALMLPAQTVDITATLSALVSATLAHGHHTIAVLTRTLEEARMLHAAWVAASPVESFGARFPATVVTESDARTLEGLLFVPVWLAKGLEFEEVAILFQHRDAYASPREKGLLHTACTRALHRLTLISCNGIPDALQSVPDTLYETANDLMHEPVCSTPSETTSDMSQQWGGFMKIACFTVAALDHFPQANTSHAGGNALNQAVRFRHLGHNTLFAGAIGTDTAGDAIAALLSGEGVERSCLHRIEGKTASNRILNDAAGERYGVEGAWDSGVYADFRLSSTDWAHLLDCDVWCTHADCPDFAEALRRKGSRQRLAVDFLHLLDPERLAACAGVADICYIGGTEDMITPLTELSKGRPGVIVLTLGAQGSIAFSDGRQTRQPALETSGIVDTTGCGDAFQAAFTASWLTGGDLAASLLAGAENGWIAALARGGVPWHTPAARVIYGTHNAAKVDNIIRRIQGIPLTVTALPEILADVPEAEETGRDPLANAEQKARHYWHQVHQPVFSIDSGLVFRDVDPMDQPGVWVRRMNGHKMNDEEMIAHYAALAAKYGGRLEACYHNAICLALDETRVVRYDGDDLNSSPFHLVDTPHADRHPGFPLDSLSIEPHTGAFFIDLPQHPDKTRIHRDNSTDALSRDGFAAFFRRVLPLLRVYGQPHKP